jgi:pyruvate/2-oxoglutarate dehydrogenase complex dihydrolipoamide dehydrogenase (E3) component
MQASLRSSDTNACGHGREGLVRHDAIVLGESAATYAAALQAKQRGLDVLLVLPPRSAWTPERLSPKLRSALACRVLADSPLAADLRALPSDGGRAVVQRVEDALAGRLESLQAEIAQAGVRCIYGNARLCSPSEVEIEGERYAAAHLFVSESTRPRRPRPFDFDAQVVCDPDAAVKAPSVPRSMAIVGAADDGCELASLFGSLGTSVLLIDRRARMMRGIDRDLLRVLHAQLQNRGVDIILEEEIDEIRVDHHPSEPHAEMRLSSGRVEKCDRLVVCAGRMPLSEPVDLRSLELDRDGRGFLVTDEFGRTSQPRLYALGEVSGLATDPGTQIQRARVAVLHAAGDEVVPDERSPAFLYTMPEIATVGLTDEACERLELPCISGVSAYPLWAGGKPARDEGGLLKLVAEREGGRLLGVHVVGYCAGDSLQVGLEYLRRGAALSDVANDIFNTPGPAEAYRTAACDALLHMQRPDR